MDGPKGFDPIVKSQGTITFFFLTFFSLLGNMIMDSHEFYRKRNCIFRHALSKSARMLKKKDLHRRAKARKKSRENVA